MTRAGSIRGGHGGLGNRGADGTTGDAAAGDWRPGAVLRTALALSRAETDWWLRAGDAGVEGRMKRDMELIRKMILRMEDEPTGWAPQDFEVEGYTEAQVGYHAYLIAESGLAKGQSVTSTGSSGPKYRLLYLTPAGHDFADSARPQHIWNEVMDDVHAKGLPSTTLDMLKKLLDAQIRKRLGLEK